MFIKRHNRGFPYYQIGRFFFPGLKNILHGGFYIGYEYSDGRYDNILFVYRDKNFKWHISFLNRNAREKWEELVKRSLV